MSWLFILLLIFAAVWMIQGYRKGLLQTAISMVFLALVLVLTVWLNPYISDYIRNNTSLGQTVQEQCGKMLEEQFGDDGTAEDAEGQEAFIENLPLPQSLKDSLAQNNTAEMYQKLAVDNFSDYLSGYLARGIVNFASFVIAFLVAILLVRIVLYAVNILTAFPGIRFLNRTGGLVLGAVRAVIWIWIFFIAVTIFAGTEWGSMCLREISGNEILSWLYSKNYLMNVILSLIAS